MDARRDQRGYFLIFAFSFTKPRTARDWRSLGAFSAFLVALFTEMYGFPLTIYLLSGWLASRFPGLDLLAHNSGHLWQTLLGTKGDPHLSPIHWISDLMVAFRHHLQLPGELVMLFRVVGMSEGLGAQLDPDLPPV